MINLPTDFTSQIASSTSVQFSAFAPYTELIIGILLALLLVGGLVQLIRHH